MPNIKNKYYNAVCCLYHKTYQYKHEKKKKKSKYLLFAAVLHTAMKDSVVVSSDTQMENNCSVSDHSFSRQCKLLLEWILLVCFKKSRVWLMLSFPPMNISGALAKPADSSTLWDVLMEVTELCALWNIIPIFKRFSCALELHLWILYLSVN